MGSNEWVVGINEARKELWCQLKQTHSNTYEELGVLTGDVYFNGYDSSGSRILLALGAEFNVSKAVDQDESMDVDELHVDWSVVIDAGRNFLATIDLDRLVVDIYARLRSIEPPDVIKDRWSSCPCLKRQTRFVESITAVCLTSSVLEELPRATFVYPKLDKLYLNHGHLKSLINGLPLKRMFPNLRYLDLRHNHLTDMNGCQKLLDGLDHLEINRLGIRDAIMPSSLKAVLQTISDAAPQLDRLYLHGNPCIDRLTNNGR